jgi:hypothetical protein
MQAGVGGRARGRRIRPSGGVHPRVARPVERMLRLARGAGERDGADGE